MARKTATYVKCDESSCGIAAEVFDTNESPEGWYLVTPSVEDAKVGHSYARQGSFEFHSLKCLERWAKERRHYQENGTVREPRTSSGANELAEQRISTLTECFLIDTTVPLSVTQLAELTGIEKSSVNRLMGTMVDRGLIKMVEERRGPFPAKYQRAE